MKQLELAERTRAVRTNLSADEMAHMLAELKWISEESCELLKLDLTEETILSMILDKLEEILEDVPGEASTVFGQSRIMRRKKMGDIVQINYFNEGED